MPKYRDKVTGKIHEFDHEPTQQELETAAGPAPYSGPSTTERVVTGIGLPMAGAVIGGRLSGPLGSALGATAGQAYGDLYNALAHGEVPQGTGPRLNESPWQARMRGFGEAATEEAKRLGTTAASTLAGELVIPPILKSLPSPSGVLRRVLGGGAPGAVGRSGAGLGELATGMLSGHPATGVGAAALEAAGPIGRGIEKAVTPGTAGRTTSWDALKGEAGDLYDWLRGGRDPVGAVKQGVSDLADKLKGVQSYEVEQAGRPMTTLKGTGGSIPAEGATPASVGKIPYSAEPPAPYRPSARQAVAEEAKAARGGATPAKSAKDTTAEIMRDQKNLADVQKWRATQDEAKAAAQKIADARAGLKPVESVSESISSPIEGGSQRMTTRYVKPDQVQEDIAAAIKGGPTAPAEAPNLGAHSTASGTVSPPAPAMPEWNPQPSTLPEAPPEVALRTQLSHFANGGILPEGMRPSEMDLGGQALEPPDTGVTHLAELFKTPGGAAGKNYRLAQDAAQAGDIPTADYAREARMRTLPSQAAEPTDWIREQSDLADTLAQLKAKGIDTPPEAMDFITNLSKLGQKFRP